MGLRFAGQRHDPCAERGGETGRDLMDQGRLGMKRQVLTDGCGVPRSVLITGANVHDKWMIADALDSVVLRASRGPDVRRTSISTRDTTTPMLK